MFESYSLGKHQCPECAKIGADTRGDNLHIYSDGHQYCFGCGFYKGSNKPQLRRPTRADADKPQYEYEIPGDASPDLSFKAIEWLKKECYFAFKDILNNNILWSEKYQWLIFPIGVSDSVIGFQARNFNENKPYKWFTKFPKKDFLFVYGQDTTQAIPSLVVVEDIVSAIRVGNVQPCAALFGSMLSDSMILKIKNSGYNYLKIWLDSDKMPESLQFAQRTKQLGLNSGLIITKKDPKCHTTSHIRSLVE